jgi:ATP-binding cassette subfamily B protein
MGIVLYSQMPQYTSKSIELIDKALGTADNNVHFITEQLMWFLSLCVINEIFSVICMTTILNAEYKVSTDQMVVIKHKLDVVPISFLDKFAVGDLTRRVVSTVGEMFKETLQVIYSMSRAVFFFATTLIAMYSINGALATLIFLSLPLCVLAAKFVSKRTQKYYERNVKIDNSIYNFIEQITTLHSFFTSNGLDGREEFLKVNTSKGIIGEDTAVALNTVYITFIQNFMYLAVTIAFGLLAISGAVTDAQFMLLPTFLIYSQRFLSNSNVVTTATNVLQRVKSRAKFFFEIIDYPDDVTAEEDMAIKKIDGDIVFDGVSAKEVQNVSFTIPFGSTAAFVSDDETGDKIAELISKLILPAEGKITVGGIDLSRIKSKSYYKRMGIAFERPFILNGTIADNILYGIRKTLPENVIEVASMLGFDKFITSLPNGYETHLTENTAILTNAEQQAVNVARTVLQSPDVIILNDALNEFDLFSEQRVNEIIIKKCANRTRIFVTKRVMTITAASQIFFCHGGKIIENGTHVELISKQGAYYKAYTGI